MSLASGTQLGVYEILGPIGAGGMGEVYRARDTELNRDIAIKVLPDAFALDPERAARFRREAQTLAALNHSHIAQISSGGGRLPVWSRDGRELFFLGVDRRQIFRVPVQAGTTLWIGRPDVLFQGEYLPVATGFRPYDVLPDGRFVLIEVAADSSNAVRPDVILVQNWAQELTRRLATKD